MALPDEEQRSLRVSPQHVVLEPDAVVTATVEFAPIQLGTYSSNLTLHVRVADARGIPTAPGSEVCGCTARLGGERVC